MRIVLNANTTARRDRSVPLIKLATVCINVALLLGAAPQDSKDAKVDPQIAGKDVVPPAQSGGGKSALLSKVAPLVAQAREQSNAWQKDAELSGIWVTANPNGIVDLKQAGHSIGLQFYSASVAWMDNYAVDDSGKPWAVGKTMTAREIVPISGPFLDIDQAIARARELGLKPPKADGRSGIEARLIGVRGAYGWPNSAIWKISAIDIRGAASTRVGEMIELDAATGEQTKFLPYDPQRDFAAYRKEADALAAERNAGLGLSGDKSFKLCEVVMEVKDADNRLEILHVTLHYFRPLADGWSIFRVDAFGTAEEIANMGDSGTRGKPVMLMKGEELRNPIPKASYAPQVAPEKLLTPLEAHARLAKLKPGWQDERHHLRLAFGGSVPVGTGHPIKADGLFPALPSDARNKWLWMTCGAQAVGNHQTGVVTDTRSAKVTCAIDALTGDAISLTESRP